MVALNVRNITISNIDGVNYRRIINRISKCEAENLMQNINMSQKRRNIIKNKNLLWHVKVIGEVIMFSDIDIEK